MSLESDSTGVYVDPLEALIDPIGGDLCKGGGVSYSDTVANEDPTFCGPRAEIANVTPSNDGSSSGATEEHADRVSRDISIQGAADYTEVVAIVRINAAAVIVNLDSEIFEDDVRSSRHDGVVILSDGLERGHFTFPAVDGERGPRGGADRDLVGTTTCHSDKLDLISWNYYVLIVVTAIDVDVRHRGGRCQGTVDRQEGGPTSTWVRVRGAYVALIHEERFVPTFTKTQISYLISEG